MLLLVTGFSLNEIYVVALKKDTRKKGYSLRLEISVGD
jgi:hypothetical protein